jgi:hypothetical protein
MLPKPRQKKRKKRKKDRGQSLVARVRKTKIVGQGSWPHDLSENGPGHSVGTREMLNQTSRKGKSSMSKTNREKFKPSDQKKQLFIEYSIKLQPVHGGHRPPSFD